MRPLLHPRNLLQSRLPIRHSSSRPRPKSYFPSPPRLPQAQQAEFERLQRKAGILAVPEFSTPTPSQPIPSQPSPNDTPSTTTTAATSVAAATDLKGDAGEAIHQPPTSAPTKTTTETSSGGLFRGAPPEFEGEVNPTTGEVGGPKNEPLRWGNRSDWSYNGRCTDF